MLTERTIETFLRSVAANCTDAQYETLAKAFIEVPGLATVASAADLQIKACMRRKLMRDIEVAEHKALRIDKTIEGKRRAIDSSESNIRHCNERICRSRDIIERKLGQIYCSMMLLSKLAEMAFTETIQVRTASILCIRHCMFAATTTCSSL